MHLIPRCGPSPRVGEPRLHRNAECSGRPVSRQGGFPGGFPGFPAVGVGLCGEGLWMGRPGRVRGFVV